MLSMANETVRDRFNPNFTMAMNGGPSFLQNYGQDSIISNRVAENPIQIYNQLTQDQVNRSQSPDMQASYLVDKFKSTFEGIDKKVIMEKEAYQVKDIIAQNIRSTSSQFHQS